MGRLVCKSRIHSSDGTATWHRDYHRLGRWRRVGPLSHGNLAHDCLTQTNPGSSLPMVPFSLTKRKVSSLACWNVGIVSDKSYRPRRKKPRIPKKLRSGTSVSWSRRLTLTLYGAILNPGCRFFDKRIGQSPRWQEDQLPSTWMLTSMSASQANMITQARHHLW
jgi:hypothetical protein